MWSFLYAITKDIHSIEEVVWALGHSKAHLIPSGDGKNFLLIEIMSTKFCFWTLLGLGALSFDCMPAKSSGLFYFQSLFLSPFLSSLPSPTMASFLLPKMKEKKPNETYSSCPNIQLTEKRESDISPVLVFVVRLCLNFAPRCRCDSEAHRKVLFS